MFSFVASLLCNGFLINIKILRAGSQNIFAFWVDAVISSDLGYKNFFILELDDDVEIKY